MHESFDQYLQYLEANKSRLPADVFAFASNEERHNLHSPHSLHDAWLTALTVKENRQGHRPFEPRPTVEIVLLGPQHDREIVLSYDGVRSYQVHGKQNKYNWADTFHGDVDRHEVRLAEDGLIVHELEFISGSRVLIECGDFMCTEREYT